MPDDRWEREEAAVARALGAWPFDVSSIELLSVSENLVFRVALVDDSPVVARLHRHGYNTLVELESEHAWVCAINESGSLAASRPIEAADGRSHVEVEVADGDRRFVGVVDWVDGRPLSRELEDAESADAVADWYREVGVVLGGLHRQSETWGRPSSFRRRSWDVDGMVGPDPEWGRFWEVPGADAGQREILGRARSSLHQMLAELGTAEDRFGLIHADPYADNLFAHEGRLVLIDFDDAGFGWHLYDLSVAIYDQANARWFPAVRSAIVEGYREQHELSADHADLLSDFLLLRMLALLGWLADRPELDPTGKRLEHDLLAAVRYCEAYLSGVDPFAPRPPG